MSANKIFCNGDAQCVDKYVATRDLSRFADFFKNSMTLDDESEGFGNLQSSDNELRMCDSTKKRLSPLIGMTSRGNKFTIINTKNYTQTVYYHEW